jgi:hypothetical protein
MNQLLKSLAAHPPFPTKRPQTHDSSTPAPHPSSIAAGSFGATSANPNSRLHQFRAVPSNSDQMTPQKSFSSQNSSQQLSSGVTNPVSLKIMNVLDRMPSCSKESLATRLVDRPPHTRDHSSGSSGPAAPIANRVPNASKPRRVRAFKQAQHFATCIRRSLASSVPHRTKSHQIAPILKSH